jgi:hypothetical protein
MTALMFIQATITITEITILTITQITSANPTLTIQGEL